MSETATSTLRTDVEKLEEAVGATRAKLRDSGATPHERVAAAVKGRSTHPDALTEVFALDLVALCAAAKVGESDGPLTDLAQAAIANLKDGKKQLLSEGKAREVFTAVPTAALVALLARAGKG